MTHPGFEVATDALRTEAGVWDQQSTQMGNIASKVDGVRFNNLEAGVFQLIVNPYGDVVTQVHDRCSEAVQRMKEIADTLRAVAKTYDEEERNGIHRMKNLR
jgi:uncharacterized protein YukE